MFASKEIAALAESGQVTLANLDKVAAQAETAIAELRLLIGTAKRIADTASAKGVTITIKPGSTGE